MNVVVDSGVFSAVRAEVPPTPYSDIVEQLVGHRLLLATVTIAELRYGPLNAGWSSARRDRLEEDLRRRSPWCRRRIYPMRWYSGSVQKAQAVSM